MEFWIFIVISVIGIIIISIVAFIVKCLGYKKVMKKIRTLSTSSSQRQEDAETAQRSANRNVLLPAPPAYAISFQHPVIARSTTPGEVNSDRTDDASHTSSEEGNTLDVVTSDVDGQAFPGVAFPGESIFIPPPYCVEPPAYSEVTSEEEVCEEGSPEAPTYTA